MTDDKWCCPKCGKYYSKSYKYNAHLIRCLVHQGKMDSEHKMLSELKDELKYGLEQ